MSTPVFPPIPFGVRGQVKGPTTTFRVTGNPYVRKDYTTPPVEQPKVEPALPSVATMAKNAGKSVLKNVGQVLNRKPLKTDAEEAARRLNICKTCPFFRASDERCSQCGCFLSAKTYLRAEHCPIGKW